MSGKKSLVCVSGGAGSGVGTHQLITVLALTPNLEELTIVKYVFS
jgi:hypothetical protein